MVVSPRDSFIVLLIVSIICSYSVSQFTCIFLFCTISFILLLNLSHPSLFFCFFFVIECGLLHSVSCSCSCDGIVVSVIFPFYSKSAEFIYLDVFYYSLLC